MSSKTYLNSSWLLWGGVGSEAGTSTVLGPWAIALANKSSCGLKGNWNCFGPRALVTESREAQHNETSGQLLQWQTGCLLGVGGASWWHHSQDIWEFKTLWPLRINFHFYKTYKFWANRAWKAFECVFCHYEWMFVYLKNPKNYKKSTILQQQRKRSVKKRILITE